MNYEQLKDTLMSKLEQELSQYKQNLIKNCTPEEIIEKSYETTFKEEIISILNCLVIGRNEIKALLKEDKALNKIYSNYMSREKGMLDNLVDITRDILEDIDKEFMKKREEVR